MVPIKHNVVGLCDKCATITAPAPLEFRTVEPEPSRSKVTLLVATLTIFGVRRRVEIVRGLCEACGTRHSLSFSQEKMPRGEGVARENGCGIVFHKGQALRDAYRTWTETILQECEGDDRGRGHS